MGSNNTINNSNNTNINNNTNTNNNSNTNNIQINSNNNLSNNNNEKKPIIIWIDYSIENKENSAYIEQLQNLGSFKGFNSIQSGINEILKIKFKRLILILSKRMFSDFIVLFEKEKNKIFLLFKYSCLYS